MKNRICLVVGTICLTATVANAQIFNQKNSQLRRLAEQIVALKAYGGYIKEGYKIARKGLNTINDLKKGDLKIHTVFFSSLRSVNPNIKRYAKVADVIFMVAKINHNYRPTTDYLDESRMYGEEDLELIKRVLREARADAGRLLNDLNDLVKDGNMELKDDERILRIDQVHSETVELFAFNEKIRRDVVQISKQRKQLSKEVRNEMLLHGIK